MHLRLFLLDPSAYGKDLEVWVNHVLLPTSEHELHRRTVCLEPLDTPKSNYCQFFFLFEYLLLHQIECAALHLDLDHYRSIMGSKLGSCCPQ